MINFLLHVPELVELRAGATRGFPPTPAAVAPQRVERPKLKNRAFVPAGKVAAINSRARQHDERGDEGACHVEGGGSSVVDGGSDRPRQEEVLVQQVGASLAAPESSPPQIGVTGEVSTGSPVEAGEEPYPDFFSALAGTPNPFSPTSAASTSTIIHKERSPAAALEKYLAAGSILAEDGGPASDDLDQATAKFLDLVEISFLHTVLTENLRSGEELLKDLSRDTRFRNLSSLKDKASLAACASQMFWLEVMLATGVGKGGPRYEAGSSNPTSYPVLEELGRVVLVGKRSGPLWGEKSSFPNDGWISRGYSDV